MGARSEASFTAKHVFSASSSLEIVFRGRFLPASLLTPASLRKKLKFFYAPVLVSVLSFLIPAFTCASS